MIVFALEPKYQILSLFLHNRLASKPMFMLELPENHIILKHSASWKMLDTNKIPLAQGQMELLLWHPALPTASQGISVLLCTCADADL